MTGHGAWGAGDSLPHLAVVSWGWGGTQAPITGHLFAEGGLACRPVSCMGGHRERVKSQVSQEQESVTSRVKGRQERELMVDLSSSPSPQTSGFTNFQKI